MDAISRPRAASLTRVLELLAARSGVTIGPRLAWEAAASALARRDGDWVEVFSHGARLAKLSSAGCEPRRVSDPRALVELSPPALSWIPGAEGGRWLVLLGCQRGVLEVAIIDDEGEQRRRMSPATAIEWLQAQGLDEGAQRSSTRWLQIEPLLPLASVERPPASTRARVGPIRRLRNLTALDRQDVTVILVYALAIGAMTLAVPVAVQALVNTVAFGTVLQPLVVLSILLAAGLGFTAVLRVLQAVVVEMLQRRLFVRVAGDFARRLPRLSPATRARHHGPELANRFFDVLTLQKAGASLLLDGTTLALQLLVGLLLLAFYHPLLLAFALALLLAVLAVVLIPGRGAVDSSLAESKRKYAVAAWLEDLAGSPRRFSDRASRRFADARAELLIREWLAARAEHYRRLLRQLIGGVGLQVAASTALLCIGGWLVIRRQLTLGQLVAAELVVTAIGAGLGKLGKQLENFYDATAAAEKLGKVLDLPLERSGGERPPAIGAGETGEAGGAGPFAVRVLSRKVGVDALDPDAPAPEVLLELEPGARAVLAGCSPARSRLCDRLFGLIEDERRGSGERVEVHIDGCPLAELDLELLRSELAMVRGFELVAGSLLDNLDDRPAQGEAQALRAILELVGLDQRVAALPDGLKTRILPGGAPLSEHEARRLVLARELLRRPRLLIIDGGLDGLGLGPGLGPDGGAFERLLDHLFDPAAPWTLLVVSDDPRVQARAAR
ncbi:ABC transporter ATP-binding protein [Pseudenhygromyxa sp. WMMC2535]|uniref:ABC transporter ATP-binding protein n=1 Tax=Pseudenhygromyxa sp. WMMC2535 TaxID=2712867 RepID=UPI001595A43D|nr:ABC transporter ATP-binding protein [Pseudenhygromyxa sp. WMMC2535]NVB38062.1 ABC transporter ATP-binding protein [Pseudenhygromyxa sp. WMMC2535]